MPIRNVSQVKKRLNKYSHIEYLPDQDKKRFADILKRIEITQRSENNYLTYLKTKGRPKVSTYYLIASINWLNERGFLETKRGKNRRQLIFLTDTGRNALQILDDFFSFPLDPPELVINLNLDENKEVKANLQTEDLDNITKTAILSNPFIRDRILELSIALCSSYASINLSVNVPPIKAKTMIAFLKTLWDFYCQTINKSTHNPLGPLCIDTRLINDEDNKFYTEFWKKHLETYIKFQGKKYEFTMFHGEKNLVTQHPFFPLLPQKLESLLPIFLGHEEVKMWIENQLDKDPDWFMPHFFWVKLGLKQSPHRENIESVKQVSPPSFHKVISVGLPQDYEKFDSMIRYVVRKEDENSVKTLCNWIAKEADWNYRDFYECWRILKKVYVEKINNMSQFHNLAKILDAALFEYILNEQSPNVDLQSVLNSYFVSEDTKGVIEEIREGKHEGAYRTEKTILKTYKIGNIYSEKQKAWLKFIEKYCPKIADTSKIDTSIKISKKFLEEFAQYWKKDYWTEKENGE